MMLAGAVVGFAASVATGSGVARHRRGRARRARLLALIFGVLTLTFLANQVATGLALTIFGIGFSALIGAGYRRHRADAAAEARHRRACPICR